MQNTTSANAPQQTPTLDTTTTTLPSEAGHMVISVASTRETKQMPLERSASLGELVSRCLVISTGTSASISLLGLLAPAYVPLALSALAGTTLLALGVRGAYKGKLLLTEAALAAAVVVGLASVSLRLTPTADVQALPSSVQPIPKGR